MQVDPVNHMLKAPISKRLKLKYDKLLSSNFAYNFNLRRYTEAALPIRSDSRAVATTNPPAHAPPLRASE